MKRTNKTTGFEFQAILDANVLIQLIEKTSAFGLISKGFHFTLLIPGWMLLSELRTRRPSRKSAGGQIGPSTPSALPLDRCVLGDCVTELTYLPAASFQLVILDPPFFKVVREPWDYRWRTIEDWAKWCMLCFRQVTRVMKRAGSLFLFGWPGHMEYLYLDIIKLGFELRNLITIDKGLHAIGGRATKGYKMFPHVTESLWFLVKDSKPFIRQLLLARQRDLGLTAHEINSRLGVSANGGGMWSLYTGNNIDPQIPTHEMWDKLQVILKFAHPYEDIAPVFNPEMGITDVWPAADFGKETRYHPAQKPVAMMERIIRASTNEGDVILDPFVGCGSTALASLNLNRHYLCIEQDRKYWEIANQRIDEKRKTQTQGLS
jgi:adenine-specific DNA-methyltransferase